LAVLLLQALQPLRLRYVHAAILRAPLVERRIAHTVFAAKLRRRKPCLVLLQNADDLFVGKSRSLHGLSPPPGDRLTSKRGQFRGAGHPDGWRTGRHSRGGTRKRLRSTGEPENGFQKTQAARGG